MVQGEYYTDKEMTQGDRWRRHSTGGKMKKLLVIIILAMIFSSPSYAQDVDLSGELSLSLKGNVWRYSGRDGIAWKEPWTGDFTLYCNEESREGDFHIQYSCSVFRDRDQMQFPDALIDCYMGNVPGQNKREVWGIIYADLPVHFIIQFEKKIIMFRGTWQATTDFPNLIGSGTAMLRENKKMAREP